MVIGTRYDLPDQLAAHFFGDCLHKVDGPAFGRLDGAKRDEVRVMLQGE